MVRNYKKHICILFGASGVGKSTLASYMTTKGFNKIKTTTTRPQRTSKDNEYNFVTKDQFKHLNTFASTCFDGNYYGTDLDAVKKQLHKNPYLVIILTFSGVAAYVKEFQNTDVQVVPIELTASQSSIIKHLKSRKDEHLTKSDINNRLASYRKQHHAAINADFVIFVARNYDQLSKQQNRINEYDQVKRIMNSPYANL